MSPKCLPEKQRRQIIRDNILSHSYEKLAQLCSCSKRTIIRTINKWRLEGGYEDVLWDEFARSYPIVKEHDPGRAFDRLIFLLGKTFTHRVEAYTMQEIHDIKLHIVKVDRELIKNEPSATVPHARRTD